MPGYLKGMTDPASRTQAPRFPFYVYFALVETGSSKPREVVCTVYSPGVTGTARGMLDSMDELFGMSQLEGENVGVY